jgi:hypothetical protein
MFFRVKSAGSYQYLQIVHSVREGEKVRQQVFGTLGRMDALKASGRLEARIPRLVSDSPSGPAASSIWEVSLGRRYRARARRDSALARTQKCEASRLERDAGTDPEPEAEMGLISFLDSRDAQGHCRQTALQAESKWSLVRMRSLLVPG